MKKRGYAKGGYTKPPSPKRVEGAEVVDERTGAYTFPVTSPTLEGLWGTYSKLNVKVVNSDAINPQHYQQYRGFEVIDVTEQLNFCLGNATKYILRAGHKPGNSKVQDLEKAKWYIEREIGRIENEGSN